MTKLQGLSGTESLPRLATWPLPAKVLASAVVFMMMLGMVGALAQVTVHDIIPTLSGNGIHSKPPVSDASKAPRPERGDLFASALVQTDDKPFYTTEDFLFALKFTHIHIFGMSAIFIIMGALVVFIDAGRVIRAWLIALPFIGIVVDLLSVWLKTFADPIFFWLHIPGGFLFVVVFMVDAVWVLQQMWWNRI